MRHLIVLTLAALLTSCAPLPVPRGPVDTNLAYTDTVTFQYGVALEPGDALVIIGLSIVHPRTHPQFLGLIDKPWVFGLGWIAYDPGTMKRTGKLMAMMNNECGRLWNNFCSGTDYVVHRIPAGTYALGWAAQDRMASFTRFDQITSTIKYAYNDLGGGQATFVPYRLWSFSDAAVVRPTTPVFSVQPGDIVYVGDVILDFGDPGAVSLSWKQDEAAARAWLRASEAIKRSYGNVAGVGLGLGTGTTGIMAETTALGTTSESLADKMATRPLRQAGGAEITGSLSVPYDGQSGVAQ